MEYLNLRAEEIVTLLKPFLERALANHPLPWRVAGEAMNEVQCVADGEIIARYFNETFAHLLLAYAEEWRKRDDQRRIEGL